MAYLKIYNPTKKTKLTFKLPLRSRLIENQSKAFCRLNKYKLIVLETVSGKYTE